MPVISSLPAVLLASLAVAGPGAVAAPLVEWSAGRVSVTGEQTSRARILEVLAARTGVEIRGLDMLPDDEITVYLSGVSLHEALRRLLSPVVDSVFVEDASPSGPRPVLVVIVGSRGRTPVDQDAEPTASRAAGELDEPRLAALLVTLEAGGPEADQALRAAALDADPDVQMVAREILAARNPREALQLVLEGRLRSQSSGTGHGALSAEPVRPDPRRGDEPRPPR